MANRYRSVLALGAAALSLSACSNTPTQWMPNGYRYEDNTPISSPAPSRPWSDKIHANLDRLGDNTAAWQGAVYELINPLPAIIPPVSSPLTLVADEDVSGPANTAFDHYLRQGLLSYGYTVNPSKDNDGIHVIYGAEHVSGDKQVKQAQQKLGQDLSKKGAADDVYELTIKVVGIDGKTPITQQSTFAILPYEKK